MPSGTCSSPTRSVLQPADLASVKADPRERRNGIEIARALGMEESLVC